MVMKIVEKIEAVGINPVKIKITQQLPVNYRKKI
jgi:hypothetical protein